MNKESQVAKCSNVYTHEEFVSLQLKKIASTIEPVAICRFYDKTMDIMVWYPDMSVVNIGRPWLSSISILEESHSGKVVGAEIHRGHFSNSCWHETSFLVVLFKTGWFEIKYTLRNGRDWNLLKYLVANFARASKCVLWNQPLYTLKWHLHKHFHKLHISFI